MCHARFTGAIDDQHVAGRKFLNSAKESLRRRRSYESQIVIERLFVYFRRDRRMFEDGFDLGSEDEPAVVLVKVERLHARAITRQHELFAVSIPQGDGIVALDIVNKIETALFIKMQDGF